MLIKATVLIDSSTADQFVLRSNLCGQEARVLDITITSIDGQEGNGICRNGHVYSDWKDCPKCPEGLQQCCGKQRNECGCIPF